MDEETKLVDSLISNDNITWNYYESTATTARACDVQKQSYIMSLECEVACLNKEVERLKSKIDEMFIRQMKLESNVSSKLCNMIQNISKDYVNDKLLNENFCKVE